MPRDRSGSVEPPNARKNQRRVDGLASMVISLASQGVTNGELKPGVLDELSREAISDITDRVLGELPSSRDRAWLPVVVAIRLFDVSVPSSRELVRCPVVEAPSGCSLSSAATAARNRR